MKDTLEKEKRDIEKRLLKIEKKIIEQEVMIDELYEKRVELKELLQENRKIKGYYGE